MGYNVSGALNGDHIADADVFAANILFVVERGMLYGCAANDHWLQYSVGIQAAGTAHVNPNLQQTGDRLLGGEFVSDGPARLPPHNS